MRTKIIGKLLKNANKSNVFLMVGDLGYSVVEDFVAKYPERFLNAGIAEQNMTGMAAGLASEGFKVFTYSIGNFNTLRCLEQIRNDVCYHNLDVTIISTGGGFAYGSLGYSHHALQDIATLGSLPFMTLLLPADPVEAEFCSEFIFSNAGPKYLRLGRSKDEVVHLSKDKIAEICTYNQKQKTNYALVTVGAMLKEAVRVQDTLGAKTKINIYSCPVIGENFALNARKEFSGYKYVFTLEDHVVPQGFGSHMAKALELEETRVISFGLNHCSCYGCGNQDYLHKHNHLDAKSVSAGIAKIIGAKKGK